MRAAEMAVQAIEFVPEHNSRAEYRFLSNLAQVSSLRLGEMGLREGNNTSFFGNEIIGGNDQVYFYLRTKQGGARAAENQPKDPRYGQYVLNADSSYAREHAWASAFVMYPDQLLELELSDHDAHDEVAAKVVANRYEYRSLSERTLMPIVDVLHRQARLLHRLDFTLGDLEQVFRIVALTYLDEQRRSDALAFPRWLECLGRGTCNLNLADLVFRRMGFAGVHGVELKFPVAVPTDHLTFVRGRR